MRDCIIEILESLSFIWIGVFILKLYYKHDDTFYAKASRVIKIMWCVIIIFEVINIILQIINISRL